MTPLAKAIEVPGCPNPGAAGPRPGFTVRRLLGCALLMAALVGCPGERPDRAGDRPAAAVSGTEILWDEWGVPHIFAETETDLFRAHGWAQMQSHGDRILILYGQARGRAAEYWGEGYLDSDRWVRSVDIPERATRWMAEQSPDFGRNLEAFVDGINAYAETHPDRIADSLEVVLPVRATDVLAHFQRTIIFTFIASPAAFEEEMRRYDEQARRRAESRSGSGSGSGGSNAWAIAPSRSASGHAMLLANPHLPWFDLFRFYEVHLIGPEVDVYGATLIGLPVPGIGFNDDLGWTHTVNTHDGADLYELKLSGDGYRWGDTIRTFEIDRDTIRVRQADGSFRLEPFSVRHSIHGPVVAARPGVGLALRTVGLDASGIAEQWWAMAKARNLAQFEDALRRLQVPTFTVIYADREGHILHLFGGLTPVRPPGPSSWAGVVPGDRPETLWTETHPYDDLPRVLDPPSGWLQNANDPPWTTTFPGGPNPADYPDYMAPLFMGFRAQRSVEMLMQDEEISLEELIEYKHSTRMGLADRLLDDLLPAARQLGGDGARRAAAILESWDRTADADSRGGVLFQAWYFRLRRSEPGSPFERGWEPDDPLATPDGLGDPQQAVAMLDSAAAAVQEAFGALDVSWGEVYRLRDDEGLDLPANGGPGELGIFRVVGYAEDSDGLYRARFGDSWVAAIEFGPEPRARALLSYGNSSQTDAPGRKSQLELFARKELRPVWRHRQEIEEHLALREVF